MQLDKLLYFSVGIVKPILEGREQTIIISNNTTHDHISYAGTDGDANKYK